MNFKTLFKGVTFKLLVKLALANDCDDIKSYLEGKSQNYEKNISKCEVNNKGEVITLAIQSDTLEEGDLDKILSYNTIKNLDYNYGIFDDGEGDSHFSTYPHFSKRVQKLTNLEELTLSYTGLREYDRGEIGDDTLRYISSPLKKLTLKGLSTYQMHIAQIGELRTLEELHIIDASEKQDYSYLSGLINLKVFEVTAFHHNPFIEFPYVLNYENLEKLIITGHEITSIPKDVGELKHLKYIDLHNNHISEIPEFLNNLPKLEYIDLTLNKDIKGKTLTNENLKTCKYEASDNLCKAKEMNCFDKNLNIKACDSSSTPPSELPISTNGKCAKGVAKCPEGECCSKYGYCGTSEKHCSLDKGCQSELGKCSSSTSTELPISTNGKCAKGVAKCPEGECCSKYGYCGTSEKHCSLDKGCQSELGKCSSSTSTELPISTNGKCAKGVAKCPEGECCSKYGYCGTSEKHCSLDKGCQSELGKCSSPTSTTTIKKSTKKSSTKKTSTKKTSTLPISTSGKCGKGVGKCPPGQCCSKYGWCGTSSSYYSTGCQKEFGECK
jgi:hypothetical protein